MSSPKPEWIRAKLKPFSIQFRSTSRIVNTSGVATVCEEAHCPNIGECWSAGTATFMIMGEICTRSCKFCAVKTAKAPPPLDPNEPERLARAIQKLGLSYVVITSVDRDDLEDQGAEQFARSIRLIRQLNPKTRIEVLIPDFRGKKELILKVANEMPDVFGHNLETTQRLTPIVRDRRATYEQSLKVLRLVKKAYPNMITKSGLMVGLGETKKELVKTMQDLRTIEVDILTIGQYLQPSRKHFPLQKYYTPSEFKELQQIGEKMGFKKIFAGSLVRSSYRAAEVFIEGLFKTNRSGTDNPKQ